MRKPYTLLISACILLLLSFEAIAQNPAPDWTKLYAGPKGTGAIGIELKVLDGFVYVSGTGDGAPLVVRYDTQNPSASPVIMSFPGAGGNSEFVVDEFRNVYVISTVISKTNFNPKGNTVENNDFITIKFNPDGSVAWSRVYAGPAGGYDRPHGIALDMSGNVYVTGAVDDLVTRNGQAIVTLKYSPSGEQIWMARLDELENVYGTDKWERPSDIVLDQAGDVYITGKIGTVMMVAKYAGSYTGSGPNPVIWRDLVTEGTDGRSIGISNGNIIASGWGGAIVSYTPEGTRNWVKDYGLAFWNMSLSSSAIYTTGSSGRDMLTAKYDLGGNEQWRSTFNPSTGSGTGYSVAYDDCGNVYMTGRLDVEEGRKTIAKLSVIKYNDVGDEQWVTYNGSSGRDIATDPQGAVYITGVQYGKNLNYMITAKYPAGCTPPTQSVSPYTTMEESGVNSLSNFPNPFKSSTNISFRLAKAGFVSLNVYDLTGRKVQTLIQEKRNAGQHSVKFSGYNLAAGTYIYRLEADGYSKTGRMILEK
jgi:hypothetical protein